MTYIEHKNEIEIFGITDFDLARIFECGQCFRWNQDENGVYVGVAFGRVIQVRKNSDSGSIFITCSLDDFKNIWYDYFDFGRDYYKIRQSLCIDDFMRKATDFGAGIRILKQDKWEALLSFIISQNNNIPRIKSIVDNLCRLCGDRIEFNNQDYFSFPSAPKLAGMDTDDLISIRAGYRADYLIKAARDIAEGKINLDDLHDLAPEDARRKLKTIHGVGDKVADCMMLFGLNMLDVFPLDVWMKRAVSEHYGSHFNPDIFTPYAGIAQQYIFHYMRNH